MLGKNGKLRAASRERTAFTARDAKCWIRVRIVLGLLLAVIAGSAVAVEDLAGDPYGAKLARGFSGTFAQYDFNDIDSVSTYNGNLSLRVPIGGSYPAGGQLSYGLTAYFNSNLEDVRQRVGFEPDNLSIHEYSVSLPNAGSTAGLGWSLHLGRLIEPVPVNVYNNRLTLDRERQPKPGLSDPEGTLTNEGWKYLAPDDSVVKFEPRLYRNETIAPRLRYSRNGQYLRLQWKDPGTSDDPNLGACPAASTGVLRCAYIEFPNGDIHYFEKKTSWPDSTLNKDQWRLREIRDRTNTPGVHNKITVNYFANRWDIVDRYGRAQKIYWEADGAAGWYYGRVDRVELTAFGGTTATYDFQYDVRTFQRLNDTGNQYETRQVGVLKRIVRPDGRAYEFVMPTVPGSQAYMQQIDKVLLPNGGSVEWLYTQFVLPSTAACVGFGSAGTTQTGVEYRVAKSATGIALKETYYLWGLYKGGGIPDAETTSGGYCYVQSGPVGADRTLITPRAEHVGAVFQKYATGKASLTLNYFSVWPYPSITTNDGEGGTLWTPAQAQAWGWKAEEFGQPFTYNVRHTSSGGLLSSEIYDCARDTPGTLPALPDPKAVATGCVRKRATYVLREGVRSEDEPCPLGGCTPGDVAAVWNSLAILSGTMTTLSLTRYLDDGSHFTKETYSDNDGFGHYRIVTTVGDIGPSEKRDERTIYNNGRGTLDLLPDGRIDTVADENGDGVGGDDDGDGGISSWTNYARADAWVLTTYTQKRVREFFPNGLGNQLADDTAEKDVLDQRISDEELKGQDQAIETVVAAGTWRAIFQVQACFYGGSGMLRRVRVRNNVTTDSVNDLVRVYEYDTINPGLPVSTRIYGGDKAPLPAASTVPGTNIGCNYAFEANPAPYKVENSFDRGVLMTQKVSGASTYLVDNRNAAGASGIDANTSLVAASRDSSGAILSTATYDTLSRLTGVIRKGGTGFTDNTVAADETYTYFLPGYVTPAGWAGPIDKPFSVVRSYEGATTFQESIEFYDAIGRNFRSLSRHPESGYLCVERQFTAAGQVGFETVAQQVGSITAALACNSANGTSSTYDVFGRPTVLTAADGQSVYTAYLGIRERKVTASIGVTDTAGGVLQAQSTVTATFDRYGNTLSVSEPMANSGGGNTVCGATGVTCKTTIHTYDGLNRAVKSVRGVQTRLRAYDGRGFLKYERLPELGGGAADCTTAGAGCRTYTQYDALGNAGLISDGNSAISYAYDGQGRVSTISEGSGAQRLYLMNTYGTTGYANGKLTQAERHNYVTAENSGGVGEFAGGSSLYGDRRVTYMYTYEPNGLPDTRQIQVHHVQGTDPFLMAQFDQSWDYDSAGRVRNIRYPRCTRAGCNGTDTLRDVAIAYTNSGQPLGITTTDNLGVSLAYHDNGQLKRISHHGTAGRHDWFGRGPGGMRRTGSINLANGSATDSTAPGYLNLGGYVYDGAGNITQVGTIRYTYDYNSRLVKSTQAGAVWGSSQTFAYDLYDNMTAAAPDTFVFDQATNRMIADMEHNPSGHVTRVGQNRIYYDDFGRQESMVFNTQNVSNPCQFNNITGSCWLYWYGPDGERVGGIELLAQNMGDYFWTIRDMSGKVLRSFKSVNESIRPTEDLVYAGRLLIGSKDAATGIARHLHSDHLGSTRVVTNATTGALIGTRSFSPYGRQTANTDTVGQDMAEWAAYEKDPNGFTHNLKARQYFNVWGRFMTPDPANDGWNLYAYAGNNPITKFDPNGLQCRDVGYEANSEVSKQNNVTCAPQVPRQKDKLSFDGGAIYVIGKNPGRPRGGTTSGGATIPSYGAVRDGDKLIVSLAPSIASPEWYRRENRKIKQAVANFVCEGSAPFFVEVADCELQVIRVIETEGLGGLIESQGSSITSDALDSLDEAAGMLVFLRYQSGRIGAVRTYDPYAIGTGEYEGIEFQVGIGPAPVNRVGTQRMINNEMINLRRDFLSRHYKTPRNK